MKKFTKLALAAGILSLASVAAHAAAGGNGIGSGIGGGQGHGVPGPIAGAGLPLIGLAYGFYAIRRRRAAMSAERGAARS